MQPDTAVAEAEREAADAQELLDALAERVANGDDTVTPEKLAKQRSLAEFAQLRVETARRRSQKLREDQRQQLAERARSAARHLLGTDGSAEVVAATMAAAAAVEDLRRVVEAHNANVAAVGAIVAQLSNSLAQEGHNGAQATRRYGVWGDSGHLVVSGGHVRAYAPGELAAAAFLVGLGTDASSVGHVAQARGLLDGQTNLAIGRVGRDVPGLADAWRLTPEQWQDAGQQGRYRASEQDRRPKAEG